MQCRAPLRGWRAKKVNKSGKRSIVFDIREGFHDLPVEVPCGRCVSCLLNRSRVWAIRCMHEASLSRRNAFVTLTYDDDHLPKGGSLDRKEDRARGDSDFQRFMKRLRMRHDGDCIRYYHVGEYGERDLRPHHHVLLFGFDFSDQVHWSIRKGNHVFRSKELEKVWPYGFSEIGEVTFQSAAYCSRYLTKYYSEERSELMEVLGLQPEYATMSRNPGIGYDWYSIYGGDVMHHDSVIVNGREVKPPQYYDKLFERMHEGDFKRLKRFRELRRDKNEERTERVLAKAACEDAMLKLKKGGEL